MPLRRDQIGELVRILTSDEPQVRHSSLDRVCACLPLAALLAECDELDRFWRGADNLYQRVRALFFLYAIHRFHLPPLLEGTARGRIPYDGARHLWNRRFGEAIETLLSRWRADGPSETVASGLAAAYRELGFQTLADQVRRSVRSVEGNAWMFALRDARRHPFPVRSELIGAGSTGERPALVESTPVRMDLTHSGWSDIFFLGMDYPEGAKVLNVSIDLALRGRDPRPRPPIETSLRVLDRPCLRLVSVDLGVQAEITDLAEVFDFARDYLGLLKAAVIASGLVPPGLEGERSSEASLSALLASLVGPGRGLELSSHVRGIPRGSRLAVSTSLLASLIALCMRATGQTRAIAGTLEEDERRLVVARAILGEWLGGSGGGWQDSGGLWPSIKLIEGAHAVPGDPEYGVSRGRLLPRHTLLDGDAAPASVLERLQESLVLVHGGMAQDVGPILQMVTERYLLRSEDEWQARLGALDVLDAIRSALRRSDVPAIGAATTANFFGPIQAILPWASNLYTERVIASVRARYGDAFHGFWMLGGMAGGGMGFLFDPRVQAEAKEGLATTLLQAKHELEAALPFAMDPVVYDFAINEHGSLAELRRGSPAPGSSPAARVALQSPATPGEPGARGAPTTLDALLAESGFDRALHEEIRTDLLAGRIGLARNRLPAHTRIEDVRASDVVDARRDPAPELEALGAEALRAGRVAIVTLAGGSGTRWTQGAGVVKALSPFCKLAGAHRSFLEVNLAKTRRRARESGRALPHVVTTSYLTHAPIERALAGVTADGDAVHLSRGRAVGLRLVPMERDLRFAWEELESQRLDERAQKVRESLQAALVRWAREAGEGSDYRDNLPHQCLHPIGHWYEVPNMLLNGTLARLLAEAPELTTLLLHNVDTVGADADPALLGLHLASGAALSFEVIPRHVEDRGGGLARADGHPRIIEAPALPRESDEFELSFYNSMTTWIDIDRLLACFGLTRAKLGDAERVGRAVRALARQLPTYVTLKEVKKRLGHGHEDVFPVSQFEKLWSDMTALPGLECAFVVVPRRRGQQLKEPAQRDAWLRDGSAAYVESLCEWE